jgi:eukaryotic-like serine/threonine-protein kinase
MAIRQPPSGSDVDLDIGEIGSAETVESASTGASAIAPSSGDTKGFRSIDVGATLGRYAIETELGQGGMATVYRARDKELRRDVAIKVLFPHLARKREVVRRFSREARAAAGLEHTHILRVYDVGGGEVVGGDPPYIVMELVRGESLRELAEKLTAEGGAGAALGAEAVASMGAVLCDALAVAHAAGVVHRDVKPANILVAAGGRLLLADFGVARIDDDDSVVTRTGALLGTPSFMSPEQAQGMEVDARSDLYSVGATLYQLATGSLPFAGPTARVVAQIVRGDLTPALRRAPAMGPDLARAIEKLMAIEPAQRPASAAAAAALLRQVAAAGGADDVEAELERYFADPAAYRAARPREVVTVVIARAREALARRELARAMALADRAGALVPDHAEVRALALEVARGGRRRTWAALAGGVALIAGGGAAFAMWPSSAGTAAGMAAGHDAAETPPHDAAAIVTDAPLPVLVADARAPVLAPDALIPVVDAAIAYDARGTRPIAPGPPMRVDAAPRSSIVDAMVPVHTEATPPDAMLAADAPARAAPAHVTFALDAWCDVTIDGVSYGRADRKRAIELPPGKHDLACSQGAGMASWKGSVELAPGDNHVVRDSLLGTVAVTIDVGEVRIDGVRHARGEVVPLAPRRHKLELIVGGQVAAEKWVTVVPGTPCRLRDTPELDCY